MLFAACSSGPPSGQSIIIEDASDTTDVGDVAPGDTSDDAAEDTVEDADEDVVEDPAEDVDPGDTDPDVDDTTGDPDATSDPDVAEDPISDVTPDAIEDVEPDTMPDVVMDVEPDVPAPTFEGYCATLLNPGAESGDAAGWTVTEGSFKAQQENSGFGGNYPAPRSGGGDYYFRAEDDPSSMYQEFDVEASEEALAAGIVFAEGSVWLRDWEEEDRASVRVTAHGSGGELLDEALSGPWTNTTWEQKTAALRLPAGTATVRVHLIGDQDSIFGANDAYFDDAELCFTSSPAPATRNDFLSPPYLMWATPTEVTVLFETASDVSARIDYGPTPELGLSIAGPSTQMHEIRLTGLAPGARNYYRVTIGERSMPTYDFLSALPPSSTDRIAFTVFADNQDGPENFERIVDRMATLEPDFMLSAGDCVQNGTRPEYRSQMWGPLFGLGNEASLLIGAGNHETYSSLIFTSDAARALWEDYVAQPEDEHCFGYRWGQFFVVVVDTEHDHDAGSEQYACIDEALHSDAAQTAQFRTAIFHRPPLIEFWDSVAIFPSPIAFNAGGMDAPDVREHLAPLFEETNVQLVFNGHNHLFARAEDYPTTVDWVTTGGAGGGLEGGGEGNRVADWAPFVKETIIGEHHFLYVVIEDGVMDVQAITDSGLRIAQFQIQQ